MDNNPAPYRYPRRPKNVREDLIQPSAAFRREVTGVLMSILVFILTYIVLVIAAVGLAALCAVAGYWVVTAVRNLWGILFGIGFIGLGIMVLFFLFKFVFKTNTTDRSNMIEITRRDQPLLFDFIQALAKETQTPLPKRVYVSPDVNASVFYDSGFWSMFFPVRKNLNIGLGLVNCVNVSEFKAVIAHEFGHFSQKSMKLGSYVYNVNHILYSLLYDNDGYQKTLESWGNVSNVFAFFATLTGAIVRGMQEVLQYLYGKINERYLALSRQMEFHADAVAASVSGSSPLVNALYKLDVADSCYRTVLGYYEMWIKENRKGLNAYQHHSIVLQNFADFHSLPTDHHNLLQVSADSFKKYNSSRVVIKDQWASHPDTIDREKHLNDLNLEAEIVADLAWTLFVNAEKLQQEVTGNIYGSVRFQQEPAIVDKESFHSLFHAQVEKYSFNKAYEGFYDNRKISRFDPEAAAQKGTAAQNLADVLTLETLSLPVLINGLTSDIQILEALDTNSPPIKTFDFEGKKHAREEAPALVLKLKQELHDANAALARADEEMFRLYYKKSATMGKEKDVIGMYQEIFSLVERSEPELNRVTSMIRDASQLFQPGVTEGMAIAVTNNMTREGTELKNMIRNLLADEDFNSCYSADEKKLLQSFLDDQRKYFLTVRLDPDAINLYMDAIHLYGNILSERIFDHKKKTLEAQVRVIQGEPEFA